jgi:hypothetical protein
VPAREHAAKGHVRETPRHGTARKQRFRHTVILPAMRTATWRLRELPLNGAARAWMRQWVSRSTAVPGLLISHP